MKRHRFATFRSLFSLFSNLLSLPHSHFSRICSCTIFYRVWSNQFCILELWCNLTFCVLEYWALFFVEDEEQFFISTKNEKLFFVFKEDLFFVETMENRSSSSIRRRTDLCFSMKIYSSFRSSPSIQWEHFRDNVGGHFWLSTPVGLKVGNLLSNTMRVTAQPYSTP